MILVAETILEYFAMLSIMLLILPGLFSWLLSCLSNRLASVITGRLGTNCYLLLASLGIIVHELSHLIMALLFGHHIQHFRLLQLPKNNQVGFVQHSANPRNPWQTFGNLLIGTAPIFGNGIVIYFLTLYLQPNLFNFTLNLDWQFFLWLLLTFSLLLGVGLSSADLHNASQGLWIALLLIFLAALAMKVFKNVSMSILVELLQQEMIIGATAFVLVFLFYLLVKMIISLLP
ncbi:MAG: hypothetical protein ABF411_06175 [Oenococcus kitaharae]|uniref:hypothetical protein n=3 Tax=Oenococcus TaxID=46254 RepID=UPI0039E8D43F